MVPALKLNYFPGNAGRAQPVRLALFMASIPFEDVRLTRPEFMEKKPNTDIFPMGQMPTLEVDGKVVCQGSAILRYAGKLAGMYPSDAFQALKCDEIMDCMQDAGNIITPTFYMPDGEEKTAKRKELAAGPLPEAFQKIEKILQKNGYKYAAGDDLTIADLSVYGSVFMIECGMLDGLTMDVFKGCDKLLMINNAVKTHPKVDEWVAKHTPPKA